MNVLGTWTLVLVSYLFGLPRPHGLAGLGRLVAGADSPVAARDDHRPDKPVVVIGCDASRPQTVTATIRFRLHRSELSDTRLDVAGSENANFESVVVIRGTSRVIPSNAVAFGGAVKSAAVVGDNVVVRVAGLQSGINYVWRVVEEGRDSVVASESTETSAIVCP